MKIVSHPGHNRKSLYLYNSSQAKSHKFTQWSQFT